MNINDKELYEIKEFKKKSIQITTHLFVLALIFLLVPMILSMFNEGFNGNVKFVLLYIPVLIAICLLILFIMFKYSKFMSKIENYDSIRKVLENPSYFTLNSKMNKLEVNLSELKDIETGNSDSNIIIDTFIKDLIKQQVINKSDEIFIKNYDLKNDIFEIPNENIELSIKVRKFKSNFFDLIQSESNKKSPYKNSSLLKKADDKELLKEVSSENPVLYFTENKYKSIFYDYEYDYDYDYDYDYEYIYVDESYDDNSGLNKLDFNKNFKVYIFSKNKKAYAEISIKNLIHPSSII